MPDPLYSTRYTQSFVIIPSNTTPILGPTQANGQPLPYCGGIIALTSGNVTAKFKEDHNNPPVTFPVVAGEWYPYSLSYVYTATTATLLGLL